MVKDAIIFSILKVIVVWLMLLSLMFADVKIRHPRIMKKVLPIYLNSDVGGHFLNSDKLTRM